jgi:hypothetical protein
MEKKIKKSVLVLLLITLSTYSCGTNYYYFKPWKNKKIIPTEKIYFKVDTTDTQKDITFITTILDKIGNNLKTIGFSYEIINQATFEKMTTKEELVLSFSLTKPAYVQLNTFNPKGIPLCNRIVILQIQPVTGKLIETTASISVNDEEEGIKQFVADFTNRLTKNISIKQLTVN